VGHKPSMMAKRSDFSYAARSSACPQSKSSSPTPTSPRCRRTKQRRHTGHIPVKPRLANIPLYRNSVLSYTENTLARDKGRIAIVTNRGLGCDGRDGVGRKWHCRAGHREQSPSRIRHDADGVFAWLRGRAHATPRIPSEDVRGRRSRVVPTSGVCASSLAVMWRPNRVRTSAIRKATGAIVHRSPRRARRTPLKPFAQRRPGDPANLWSTPCAFLWRTDLRVPAGARPFLRPCLHEGAESSKPRAEGAARTLACCLKGVMAR
jgi:hypothetical protein